MSSDQLKAFDVSKEPESLRKDFGDDQFGRACLAAVRLIEVGVRCVEVTLDGWDTHANNHAAVAARNKALDPAFAALIKELKKRGLLEKTLVLCGGEFGRTPSINPAGGRDHWPHGFSIALAGGGIRAAWPSVEQPEAQPGRQEPHGKRPGPSQHRGHPRHRLHRPRHQLRGRAPHPIGRPMAISKGKVIKSCWQRSSFVVTRFSGLAASFCQGPA